MDREDVATEILSLYKALRSTPDERLQQAIKDRIDLLIEESHHSFSASPLGTARLTTQKLDA